MEQSLFLKWVNKYFPGVTISVVETLNDTKKPLTYLHRRFLKKLFSVTGKWESINAMYSLIMADIVAMDSDLPLKSRDKIGKASGDIPKMGMSLKLNETELTALDVLVAQNATDKQILVKLFADVPRVISGIYERNESMFLEALSTGMTIVEDTETVGTGVRVDYGIPAANKFGVAVLWSTSSTATPFDDLERIQKKASDDGNTIVRFLMDKTAFDNLAKATQTKELFAFYAGFVGANIPTPSLAQINSAIQSRYGFQIEVVDRTVRYERNGVRTTIRPWQDGAVTGICSEQLGSLEYARLAEQNHPVANVTYQTVDDFILVSKYRLNKPSLSEWTSSQARVVPVLNNVDQLYLLDSKTVQA